MLRKAEQCPEQLNAGTNNLRGNDKSVRCALSFTMRWRGRVSTTTAAVFSVSAALPSRSPFMCSFPLEEQKKTTPAPAYLK